MKQNFSFVLLVSFIMINSLVAEKFNAVFENKTGEQIHIAPSRNPKGKKYEDIGKIKKVAMKLKNGKIAKIDADSKNKNDEFTIFYKEVNKDKPNITLDVNKGQRYLITFKDHKLIATPEDR